MAKAVAEAMGWEYTTHNHFSIVLHNVASALASGAHVDNVRVYELSDIAQNLHQKFYTRRQFLDATGIGINLDHMEELLGILEPLTETRN